MHGSPNFTRSIGRTVEGREIVAHANFDWATATPPPNSTLIIGGTHGNEPATWRVLEDFRQGAAWAALKHLPTLILPVANPDGAARGTRSNARGVDLNRNCGFNWRAECEDPPGPAAWSEPESVALRDFILQWRPAKIVSLHWALAEIDADGVQSTALAQAMWDALDATARRPYRLRVTAPGRGQRRLERIYAACPGSLGQWCGYGLEYPDGSAPAMITLELPYDPGAEARPDELPEDHLETVRELWRRDPAGYLRGIAPGVQAMLATAIGFAA
ncbi:MAG: M14 family zinc carboxypeptidase [Chthoniobacter sp.]|uniref:M14 family zinc carboxypeptidase n=1 Tax=Chthoniobacter sp. TaxID=2510640 RepID=UPI0032A87553